MPRTPPTAPLPTLELTPPESWTVNLQTITPMFGGGAEPRQVDPPHPVRASSVRGHLRFWWRATAGAGCSSLKDLYDKESEIWGNTEKHGRVRLEVVEQKAEQPKAYQNRDLSYATFPFQEQRPNQQNPDGVPAAKATSASFTLELTAGAKYQAEIKAAVQAWVMFGGVGARTRRGCGSLQQLGGEVGAVAAPSTQPEQLTTLPAAYFLGEPCKDPLDAWKIAVETYKQFRQDRDEGKGNRPGRSKWPEPDSIRRFTPDRAFQHRPVHPVSAGFPRADLGLPIIFHFQKQRDYTRPEPRDHTLQGKDKGRERFASPVITKTAFTNAGFQPLIMILDAPHVWTGPGVKFREGRSVTREEIELTAEQRSVISPLNGLPIREALERFVLASGFQEVHL